MAASYPTSIKSFLTYQNQPGDNNHVVPDPDKPNQIPPATVDLTYDRAKVTNEIHDEVVAIEKIIGFGTVISVPGTTTIGAEIHSLYFNKANGHTTPTDPVIRPAPPPSHNHMHPSLGGLHNDDHPQYMKTDGRPPHGFTRPVTAPAATAAHQLITLNQGRNSGLTGADVQQIIINTLAGASAHPMTGPTAGRYRMTGGFFSGLTDANGNAYIDFSNARFSRLVSFVFMKNPFPGGSMLGWYNFQYMEDQLILLSLTPQGAWIQFIEDIVVDRQATVAMTWMALGV